MTRVQNALILRKKHAAKHVADLALPLTAAGGLQLVLSADDVELKPDLSPSTIPGHYKSKAPPALFRLSISLYNCHNSKISQNLG